MSTYDAQIWRWNNYIHWFMASFYASQPSQNAKGALTAGREREMSEWIFMTDRLPEEHEDILFCVRGLPYCEVGFRSSGRWEARLNPYLYRDPKVYAWMPRPTPPEEPK